MFKYSINKMKAAIILLVLTALVSYSQAKGSAANCKCFKQFKAEEENGSWLCRGVKNHRIFACGEEQPPLCHCYLNGQEEILDIGETSCTNKNYDSIYCAPTAEWRPYFERHPEKQIYN